MLRKKEPRVDLTYLSMLGKGGFATVWKCNYENNLYAAKVIERKKMSDDDLKLMKNEASIWENINHPNIVNLHTIIWGKEAVIFICELMQETLFDVHQRMRKLGTKPRISTNHNYLTNICDALIYLHSKNIVHRDIKSENILIRDSKVALGDFGLARYYQMDMTAETGSYRWMAPEVIRHEAYNTKCDVYSFAILLYEVITLSPPFASYSPIEVAFAVAKDGKRPPLPALPRYFNQLVTDCWDQDATRRPDLMEIKSRLNFIRSKNESFGSIETSEGNAGWTTEKSGGYGDGYL